ncbi:MAG: ABC transporter permease [Capnocytophaga sp.]|nr:ABC transporter permease [Capnocytophaga sp.]
MKHLGIIIKREFLNKVRNKSFVIMTFVSPILMVLFGVVIVYLTQLNSKSSVKKITILDESGIFNDTFKNTPTLTFEYLDNNGQSVAEAKANVLSQGSYGLLYIPPATSEDWYKKIEFFSDEPPTIQLSKQLSEKLEDQIFQKNLTEKGIDNAQIKAAKVRVDLSLENFTGQKSTELGSIVKLMFGGAAGYLIFMFIIIYGNMIMRSVIEEKTNRIIEIIVSSVKPFELMLGKILGTTFAGVTQFLIWMIFGGILMTVVTSILGISPSSPNEAVLAQASGSGHYISELLVEFFHFPFMTMFVSFLIFFTGGYFLYSSLYAAVGAAVDNETDTQQFLFPIMMPLMLAVYIGFFTVIEEPHGTISVIFSYIPFTSPVVMLMRIPFGVAWWEILLSAGLLYATFFLCIAIAAKIYRIGILMYGKKPTYKEIWKWLKY